MMPDCELRDMASNGTTVRQLVYGRDRRKTELGLVFAGVLFLASYLFWRLPGVSEAAYDLLVVDVVVGGFALLVLVAAVHAYGNRGLLVSWLLVFLPVLGASLNFVGVGLQTPATAETVALALAIPAASALLLGTGGYLLGRGIRRVARSAGPDSA